MQVSRRFRCRASPRASGIDELEKEDSYGIYRRDATRTGASSAQPGAGRQAQVGQAHPGGGAPSSLREDRSVDLIDAFAHGRAPQLPRPPPVSGAGLIFGPPKLALAAVAASQAFLAAMIRAGILGAVHADVSRGLVADATQKSPCFRHGLGSVLLGEAAGG